MISPGVCTCQELSTINRNKLLLILQFANNSAFGQSSSHTCHQNRPCGHYKIIPRRLKLIFLVFCSCCCCFFFPRCIDHVCHHWTITILKTTAFCHSCLRMHSVVVAKPSLSAIELGHVTHYYYLSSITAII